MIKLTQIILLSLLIVSCNSNEKKTETTAQISQDKTQSQDNKELKASISRGKIVYGDMCVTCHMTNGKGVPKAFPPLADSDYLRDNQTKSIIGVKKGMSGEMVVNGTTYNSAYPIFEVTPDKKIVWKIKANKTLGKPVHVQAIKLNENPANFELSK